MTEVRWRPVQEVSTAAVVKWDGTHLVGCDPYLVWADASTRRTGLDHAPNIGVLVELNRGESVLDLLQRLDSDGDSPPHLIPNQLGWTYPTVFVTGLVDRAGLKMLIQEVTDGKIRRFTLQGARADLSSTTLAQFKEAQWASGPATSVSAPQTPAEVSVGGSTYLGIVDDGLPFLRLRSSVQLIERRAHLWDQGWMYEGLVFNPDNPEGRPPGDKDPYWRSSMQVTPGGSLFFPLYQFEGFLYGRRTKKPPSPDGSTLCDRDEYQRSRYVHPAPRETHGASVLGLMAPWVSTRRHALEWPCYIAGLAMVQLPTETVDDTSGGSLAMRVLDGIRYVLWQELKDREDEGASSARPTVVNISYGAHGGPHDGTSMFERAAQEALIQNPHLHLVLPMGNAHRVGIHARHHLGPAGERDDCKTLLVRVMPDNPRDTFLEIWLPQGAEIELKIEPPGRDAPFFLERGQAFVAYEPVVEDPTTPGIVQFAGIYPERVANGLNGTMVLIAIGSTRPRRPETSTGHPRSTFEPVGANQQPRRSVIAPHGEWRIRLRNVQKSSCDVRAWIERDDAAPNRSAGDRQAWFPDSVRPEVRTWQVTPEETLNGVATFDHKHLHVVGAMRADGRLAFYSAARAEGIARPPDAVVVADWSAAVHGILSLGFTQGVVSRLDGTSAACAVYSRALAWQLAHDPNQLPQGPQPGFVEPEFDSGPEDEPAALDGLRGEGVRMFLRFDVEITTRPPR